MLNVVLVSGDPATHKEITALLPKGASLEGFATPDELPRPAAPAQDAWSDKIILVDLSGAQNFSCRLDPFRRAGVPLVALIGSPAEREPALRDGFDDYLLRPVSAAELALRIARLPGARGVPMRDRLAAVGRLTSYFCHDVNNALQTIRGSVDLALEEPNLSGSVAEYLALCRKETVSIGRKIDRLRQIYRLQPAPPQPVSLGALLHEVLTMAADEILRAGVAVREDIEPSLPPIQGSSDQLCLAFLMMVFQLCEEFGDSGGGELRVRAESGGGEVRVGFTPIPGTHPFSRSSLPGPGQGAALEPAALPPGLEPARELIKTHRGELQALGIGRERCLHVRLPTGGD
jgi:CheY-like chemotaxis protein